MKRARYIDIGCISLLVVCQILLSVPRLRGPIDLRWDAAVYYVLGTSLAEGKGYRLLNEPGDARAVQYPPLLPCVVAVVQRACGSSDPAVAGWWLRWFNLCAYTGYLLALYALSRRIVGA